MDAPLSSYPFDFSAYSRGAVVPNHIIRKAYPGLSDEQFELRKLALKDEMESYFEETYHEAFCIKCTKEGLQILTHHEQFEYTEKEQRRHWRGIMKMHRKDCGTDAASLTEEQQERRRDRILRNSKLFQMRLQVRRMKLPELEGPKGESPEA